MSMAKELLISLLDNGINKTIKALDDHQAIEFNDLSILKTKMTSINTTFDVCNKMSIKIIDILKNKEIEAQQKKTMTKSKTEANLSGSKRPLPSTKSQRNILNNSSINKPISKIISIDRKPKKSESLMIASFKLDDKSKDNKPKSQRLKTQPSPIAKNKKETKQSPSIKGKANEKKVAKKVVDYKSLLSNHWGNINFFLTQEDQYKIGECCKQFMKEYFELVLNKQRNLLHSAERKQREITERYQDADLKRSLIPFEFNKGSQKAILILNEDIYMSSFDLSRQIPVNDILLLYHIFFQLINKEKEQLIIQCKDQQSFWMNTCSYFTTVLLEQPDKKLGSYLDTLFKTSMDLSQENIYNISSLCLPYSNLITPSHYSRTCSTTGLFSFLIKDILEYIGILPDKRTQPALIYNSVGFTIEKTKMYIDRITSSKVKLN